MNAEICFVFNDVKRLDRNLWLPRVNKWISKNRPFFQRLRINIGHRFASLENALSWRAETPVNRVVVTVGYKRNEVETVSASSISSGEPVIIGDATGADAANFGSASFSWMDPIIISNDVLRQLRKSLIRIALRNRYKIRSPETEAEFAQYFSLRHRVWKSVGYLKDEYLAAGIEWEVDVWDRMSIPLIAVSTDNEVVGCVRLIRSLGNEEQPYASAIQSLLQKNCDPALIRLFSFENKPGQPFDVLVEFPAFRPRYRQLVREKRTVVEVGRVAVAPEHRGGFLSEALVDTALSHAAKKGFSTVILACPEKLSGLYARCGFRESPVPRVDSFFNIQVGSIMMEKQIR